jgi:polysaccharide pyruvyl transferase WcaK-like protein
MFLGFLTDEKKRRIAYGASFGTDIDEYTCEEKETCGNLFRKFSGVSVREESALNILRKFGWNTPSAIRVVDPTLLLDASEYEKLIDKIKTVRPSGNVFCYILDDKQDLRNYIDQFCSIHKMKPYYCTLNENVFPSIEQWLRNFKDSEYVITDSYHGVIFSLIFRKPFTVYENVNRGSARIMELKRLFGIKAENFQLDVSRITDIINIERSKATTFLNNSLQ